jgi:hypothetical protein
MTLNRWILEFQNLVAPTGFTIPSGHIKKIKRSGIWRNYTPQQYFDGVQKNFQKLENKTR